MKLRHSLIALAIVASGAVAYQHGLTRGSAQSPAPKPQSSPTAPAQANLNQEMNNRYVQQLSQKIAGRENEPAEKVFKNVRIEWFKNVPAGRFLRIMNGGYK